MLCYRLEPNNLGGMDVLAALLAKDKKSNKELEALASKAMSVSEEAPESWVALGYYCHNNRRMSKALYFAHKGCMAQKTFRCSIERSKNLYTIHCRLLNSLKHMFGNPIS